jgi:hypothetical protein
MKITKKQLKQIIKEELSRALREGACGAPVLTEKGPSRDEQLQAFLEDDFTGDVMDNWTEAIHNNDDHDDRSLQAVIDSFMDYFLPPDTPEGKEKVNALFKIFLDGKVEEHRDMAVRDGTTPEESMKQLYTEIIYIKGLLRKHGSEGGVDAY